MAKNRQWQYRIILNGTGPYTFDIGRNLSALCDKQWTVRLVDWSFFSTDYVVSTANNAFSITYGATTYSITIPVGNYTIATLTSRLRELIQAATGALITCSYDVNSQLITIASPDATTLSLIIPGTPVGRLLGFAVGTTATSTSVTGVNLPMVTNSPWYAIKIRQAQYNGSDINGSSFIIPNTGGPGQFVYRQCEPNSGYCVLPGNLSSVFIMDFLDYNGNPLPLQSQQALLTFDFCEQDRCDC